MNQRQKWVINQVAGKKILDIGFLDFLSLDTTIHRQIRQKLNRSFIVGVDNNPDLVRKLNYPDSIAADVVSLPFRDNVFDCVIIAEVLEHITEVNKAVFEIARVCKRGAKVIVTTPNPFGLFRLLRHWIFSKTPGSLKNIKLFLGAKDHKAFIEPLSLINQFYSHRFKLVSMTTLNLNFPYLPNKFKNPPLRFWPCDRLGTHFCAVFTKI